MHAEGHSIGDLKEIRVQEQERYMPILGWDKEFLFYTDGYDWARDGHESVEISQQRPPKGFVWIEDEGWRIETDEKKTDADGWMYAFNVTEKNWSNAQSLTSCVRKRFWIRRCVFDPVAFLAGTESSVAPEKKRAPYEPVQRVIQCFENERWVVMAGFSRRHLLPTDPTPYTDLVGQPFDRDAPLQKGWEWAGDWKIKISGDFPADDQGWSYSWNFGKPKWSAKAGASDFVRRRLWSRTVCFHPPPSLSMKEEELAKGKAAMTHERNLELITSSLPAEIAAGESVVGADLVRLVDVANETNVALNFEEKLLADRAVAALEFLDVANKAHPGKRIVCPQSSRLQEWLSGWRLRPGTELLKASTCTELDLVKRFRELEFRSSNFLEINQQILPQVEDALQPGKARWEDVKAVVGVAQSKNEEEEAEL